MIIFEEDYHDEIENFWKLRFGENSCACGLHQVWPFVGDVWRKHPNCTCFSVIDHEVWIREKNNVGVLGVPDSLGLYSENARKKNSVLSRGTVSSTGHEVGIATLRAYTCRTERTGTLPYKIIYDERKSLCIVFHLESRLRRGENSHPHISLVTPYFFDHNLAIYFAGSIIVYFIICSFIYVKTALIYGKSNRLTEYTARDQSR